jgi:AraC-like DNA-binding protein
MYDHHWLFARVSAAVQTSPGASLHQVAAGLGVHPHTLAQVVRSRTGRTFSAWRAERQLAASVGLLRNRPDLTIKEIAAAAGFNSTSVFDRFMRRACGRSPSQYRSSADLPNTTGPNINSLDHESTPPQSHVTPPDATLISSTASSC